MTIDVPGVPGAVQGVTSNRVPYVALPPDEAKAGKGLVALLAPALMGSSPLFVLLFFWTFRRIPEVLFESARLEGAGPLTVWARVAMPLARSTIVAVGVLTFLLYWSDFVSPLLYLKSQHLYTLPVGLQQLQQLDKRNWPLLMAGSVVLTAPAVFFFLIVQRYFLQEGRLGEIYGG